MFGFIIIFGEYIQEIFSVDSDSYYYLIHIAKNSK
jgi:hypothetical protein